MARLLCPSMMCADLDSLAGETQALDLAGADFFHADIMDGCFVPNFALGLEDVRSIRRHTKKPIEAHLMIEEPGRKLEWFADAGCDILTVHAESERCVIRTLQKIRSLGKKAGLALNPDTSFETVKEMLPFTDYVLAMSVSPGYAGQAFLEPVREKIRRLAEYKKDCGFCLGMDGAVSPEKIREYHALGVDYFVLGTSSRLFDRRQPFAERLAALR